MDNGPIEYHCVILAAGCGSRMREIGTDIPKCLLRINNRTLLESHLDNLLNYPINDVTIVVGYKKDKIIDKIGSTYRDLRIRYVESPDYNSTNHSWSLFLTNQVIRDNCQPVLISHADNYFHPKLLSTLIESPYEDVILVDPHYSIKTNDELMVIGDNGVVGDLRYIYEQSGGYLGEFVGLHKWSQRFGLRFVDYLEDYFKIHGKNDGYDWLIGRFIEQKNMELHYLLTDNRKWINVNHEDDYLYAKELSEEFLDNI